MSRVTVLHDQGVLVAATDLHGNLADFRLVVARFRELAGRTDRPPHLVVCGDLVHGPAHEPETWPDHLGDFYRDQSVDLLREAWQLQLRYPGQVTYLLGNHEHAHLGGPRLSKFHSDEARHLEERFAADEWARLREWLAGWPWVAVAPAARIVLTHAAPHAEISARSDLDAVRLDGYEDVPLHEMAGTGPLGALLWARTTSAERANAFLAAMHPDSRVAAFGHDVISEGHLVEREPLLCFSTSFGCHDGDKVYLEWDLARPTESAFHLAETGLRRLHPTAEPVHRR